MHQSIQRDPSVVLRTTQLLYRNAAIGQWISILNATLLSWVIQSEFPWQTVAAWWCSAMLIAAYRLRLCSHFKQAQVDETSIYTWRRRYIFSAPVSGLVWGMGLLFFMLGASDTLRIFIAFVVAAMVAGAVPILSSVLPVLQIYAFLMVLPVVVSSFLGHGIYDRVFCIMSVLFLFGILRSAQFFNETITDLVAVVQEKTRLASDLNRAREASEAASRAKSDFLANISHEIRTPMNGIVGMAQLLSRNEVSPELREQLAVIQGSTDALLSLVNDVLDFSRIEAGHFGLDPEPFAPATLLHDLEQMFRPQATLKHIELAFELSAETPEWLIGDAVRLKQVLVNLVGNALKFTTHGSVHVEAECWRREGFETEWTIAVRDTGIGVPVDKRETIFEAFAQADTSITRRFGGSGLGLSISHRLIELMGGRIWVDDNPGGGSVFRISVPLQGVDMGESASAPASAVSLKVLLAEDNPVNRLVAERFLTLSGHQVSVAEDGAQALEMLERVEGPPFDVVLMDIQMPTLDGLATTEQIRAREAMFGTAHLPIIALSANAYSEDKEACLAAGMDDFLAKPFHQDELDAALARVAARKAG